MNIASAPIKSPGETLRNRERTEKGSERPTPVFLRSRPRRTADSSFSSLLVCVFIFIFSCLAFHFIIIFLIITCLCSPINFLFLTDNEYSAYHVNEFPFSVNFFLYILTEMY